MRLCHGRLMQLLIKYRLPELSGPELLAIMKVGTVVVRGKDWIWGDQVLMCAIKSSIAELCLQGRSTLTGWESSWGRSDYEH